MTEDPDPMRWFDATSDRQRRRIFQQQRDWQAWQDAVRSTHRHERAGKIERLLVWAAILFGSATFWYIAFQLVRWALR